MKGLSRRPMSSPLRFSPRRTGQAQSCVVGLGDFIAEGANDCLLRSRIIWQSSFGGDAVLCQKTIPSSVATSFARKLGLKSDFNAEKCLWVRSFVRTASHLVLMSFSVFKYALSQFPWLFLEKIRVLLLLYRKLCCYFRQQPYETALSLVKMNQSFIIIFAIFCGILF